MEVAPCIVLIPGANYYVVPKRIKPAPSEFVVQNTYYYRLVDGQMRLKGVALGPGWEKHELKSENLSCYKQKGEREMAGKKREAPAKEELIALYIKHEGKNRRQYEAKRH